MLLWLLIGVEALLTLLILLILSVLFNCSLLHRGLLVELFSFSIVPLAVGALLMHKSVSSFECFLSNIVGSLREQLTKIEKLSLGYTHEVSLRKLFKVQAILILSLKGVFFDGAEYQVGLELAKNLVVTEVAELGKV